MKNMTVEITNVILQEMENAILSKVVVYYKDKNSNRPQFFCEEGTIEFLSKKYRIKFYDGYTQMPSELTGKLCVITEVDCKMKLVRIIDGFGK